MALKGKIYSIAKQYDDLNTNNIFESMMVESVDKDNVVMDGRNLAAGSIFAEQIHAGAITADHIKSDTINADHLDVGSIDVGTLWGDQLILPGENYGGVVIDENGLTMKSTDTTDTVKLDVKLSSDSGFNITDGSNNQLIDIDPKTGNVKMQVNQLTIGGHSAATTKDIDDLEVGGRNLISNTEGPFEFIKTNSNSYWDVITRITNVVPTGKEYILSFKAKASSPMTLRSHFYSPNTTTRTETSTGFVGVGGDGTADTKIGTEWDSYWIKWTQNKTSEPKNVIVARIQNIFNNITLEMKEIKFEKGNKATDWTTAPEDVQAEIDSRPTFQDFDKTDKVTINGGNIKAGTISSDKNYSWIDLDKGHFSFGDKRLVWDGSKMTIKAESIDLEGKVTFTDFNTDLKEKVDSKVTQSDVDSSISDIEVGGKNLLKGTSNEWTQIVRPEGSWFYEKGTDVQLEEGETYTFSVIVEKVSNDSVPINLHIGLGSTPGSYNTDVGGWRLNAIPFGKKISLTHTITAANLHSGTRTYFAWRLRNEKLATTIRFKEVKLEKGTKATDWTEAPEDTQLDVNKRTYNPIRYIRDWLNGSTANTGNHWGEIQAIQYSTGENIAKGKPVTSNGALSNPTRATDGLINTAYANASAGHYYAQVDLGQVYYDIESVLVSHYYVDGRRYHETKTEVSTDGVNWVPIFDSLIEGEYAETSAGRTSPNTQAKSESLIASQEMVNRLGDSTSRTVINGRNLTTGRVQSKNSFSWLDLDTGHFDFGNGGLVYSGGTLALKGTLSVSNLTGTIPKTKLDDDLQTEINAGSSAKSMVDANSEKWDTASTNASSAKETLDKKSRAWDDKIDSSTAEQIAEQKAQEAKSKNFGYRYYEPIVIYGDSDKYYPVIIKGGDQNVKRDILIKRGYSEQAPPDWNTSTHKGGLTLKIKTNFGGWGGANYSWEIHELEEMYTRTFAGATNVMSNMAFAIFLRGGGTTGARYHIYSDQSLTDDRYSGSNGIPISPQIGLAEELIGQTGTYSWNAPKFRTITANVEEEIRIRKFIELTQEVDTKADAAQLAANTAQSAADEARSASTTANNLLADLANDSKLTASEKKATKKEWDIIVAEKPKIQAEGTDYGLTAAVNSYVLRYNQLNTYITPLLANLNNTSNIVGTTFRSTFALYYSEKQTLLNAITSKAKTLADNAQSTANTATTNAGAANTAISDMMSDLKITPIEKTELARSWERIKAEYTQLNSQAASLAVASATRTNYTNAYNALNTNAPRIQTDILASMTTNYNLTTTTRNTFKTKMNTYFVQAETISKAITDKVQANASSAQATANTADSNATNAKTKTDKWTYPGTTLIGGDFIETGTMTADRIKAHSITADQIAAKSITTEELSVTSLSAITANLGTVTAGTVRSKDNAININLDTGTINLSRPLTINSLPVSTKKEVEDAIQDIEVGGRNLLRNSKERILKPRNDGTASDQYNFARLDYPTVDGQTYTISADVDITNGTFNQISVLVNFGNTGSSTQSVPIRNGKITRTYVAYDTMDSNAVLLYAGSAGNTRGNGVIFRNIKIEKGGKATDWTPAPEDVYDDLKSSGKVTIHGGNIIADTLSADRIRGKVPGGKITLDGDVTVDGTFTVGNTNINSGIAANKITTGTMHGNRITANTLNGNRIVANTLDADRINTKTLSAISADLGEITAGHISGSNMTLDLTKGEYNSISDISHDLSYKTMKLYNGKLESITMESSGDEIIGSFDAGDLSIFGSEGGASSSVARSYMLVHNGDKATQINADSVSTTGNMLVGGVSVVASGYSNGGHWIRFYDGTQICYGVNVELTYNNSTSLKTSVVLPRNFLGAGYAPIPTLRYTSAEYARGELFHENRTNSGFDILWRVSAGDSKTTASTWTTYTDWIAIGKWK